MATVKIDIDFPNWAEKYKSKIKQLTLFAAGLIQENRGQLFDNEGAFHGHTKWKKPVFRDGMALSKTGALRKSIAPMGADGRPGPDGIVNLSLDQITIGTTLFYAALMNWGTTQMPGGVLKATNAKALKIPLPSGKLATKTAKKLSKDEGKFIFRKSVKIPERRFDEWNAQDQAEFSQTLANEALRHTFG